MSAVLQCLFSLPLQDSFRTCVGSTQDLLRLATHPSQSVRTSLSLLVKMRRSEVKAANGEQWLKEGDQHDALDFLQFLYQIAAQPGALENNLCKVLDFESSEQMVKCHCGLDHEKRSTPRFCIELPVPSCNCGPRCKCKLSVEYASKFDNAEVEVADFLCPYNSTKGRAYRKYAGPEAPGSPKVAVVAQIRGKKV